MVDPMNNDGMVPDQGANPPLPDGEQKPEEGSVTFNLNSDPNSTQNNSLPDVPSEMATDDIVNPPEVTPVAVEPVTENSVVTPETLQADPMAKLDTAQELSTDQLNVNDQEAKTEPTLELETPEIGVADLEVAELDTDATMEASGSFSKRMWVIIAAVIGGVIAITLLGIFLLGGTSLFQGALILDDFNDEDLASALELSFSDRGESDSCTELQGDCVRVDGPTDEVLISYGFDFKTTGAINAVVTLEAVNIDEPTKKVSLLREGRNRVSKLEVKSSSAGKFNDVATLANIDDLPAGKYKVSYKVKLISLEEAGNAVVAEPEVDGTGLDTGTIGFTQDTVDVVEGESLALNELIATSKTFNRNVGYTVKQQGGTATADDFKITDSGFIVQAGSTTPNQLNVRALTDNDNNENDTLIMELSIADQISQQNGGLLLVDENRKRITINIIDKILQVEDAVTPDPVVDDGDSFGGETATIGFTRSTVNLREGDTLALNELIETSLAFDSKVFYMLRQTGGTASDENDYRINSDFDILSGSTRPNRLNISAITDNQEEDDTIIFELLAEETSSISRGRLVVDENRNKITVNLLDANTDPNPDTVTPFNPGLGTPDFNVNPDSVIDTGPARLGFNVTSASIIEGSGTGHDFFNISLNKAADEDVIFGISFLPNQSSALLGFDPRNDLDFRLNSSASITQIQPIIIRAGETIPANALEALRFDVFPDETPESNETAVFEIQILRNSPAVLATGKERFTLTIVDQNPTTCQYIPKLHAARSIVNFFQTNETAGRIGINQLNSNIDGTNGLWTIEDGPLANVDRKPTPAKFAINGAGDGVTSFNYNNLEAKKFMTFLQGEIATLKGIASAPNAAPEASACLPVINSSESAIDKALANRDGVLLGKVDFSTGAFANLFVFGNLQPTEKVTLFGKEVTRQEANTLVKKMIDQGKTLEKNLFVEIGGNVVEAEPESKEPSVVATDIINELPDNTGQLEVIKLEAKNLEFSVDVKPSLFTLSEKALEIGMIIEDVEFVDKQAVKVTVASPLVHASDDSLEMKLFIKSDAFVNSTNDISTSTIQVKFIDQEQNVDPNELITISIEPDDLKELDSNIGKLDTAIATLSEGTFNSEITADMITLSSNAVNKGVKIEEINLAANGKLNIKMISPENHDADDSLNNVTFTFSGNAITDHDKTATIQSKKFNIVFIGSTNVEPKATIAPTILRETDSDKGELAFAVIELTGATFSDDVEGKAFVLSSNAVAAGLDIEDADKLDDNSIQLFITSRDNHDPSDNLEGVTVEIPPRFLVGTPDKLVSNKFDVKFIDSLVPRIQVSPSIVRETETNTGFLETVNLKIVNAKFSDNIEAKMFSMSDDAKALGIEILDGQNFDSSPTDVRLTLRSPSNHDFADSIKNVTVILKAEGMVDATNDLKSEEFDIEFIDEEEDGDPSPVVNQNPVTVTRTPSTNNNDDDDSDAPAVITRTNNNDDIVRVTQTNNTTPQVVVTEDRQFDEFVTRVEQPVSRPVRPSAPDAQASIVSAPGIQGETGPVAGLLYPLMAGGSYMMARRRRKK